MVDLDFERRIAVELAPTLDMNNNFGTYAALMSAANPGGEYDFREELPFGSPALTTSAYRFTANVPANPTTASRFVIIHSTINGAEDTSDVSITSWQDIHSSGQAGGSHIRTNSSIRIFVYPSGYSLSELTGKPPLITWPVQVQGTSVIPLKTVMDDIPAIPLDEELSPEDREARKKGLALVARIEQLMQTEEGFNDWFQEGFDEIAAGHFVTFSEEGWKEQ